MPSTKASFIGIEKQTIFGHELQEQRRPPYLEVIIGIDAESSPSKNEKGDER